MNIVNGVELAGALAVGAGWAAAPAESRRGRRSAAEESAGAAEAAAAAESPAPPICAKAGALAISAMAPIKAMMGVFSLLEHLSPVPAWSMHVRT